MRSRKSRFGLVNFEGHSRENMQRIPAMFFKNLAKVTVTGLILGCDCNTSEDRYSSGSGTPVTDGVTEAKHSPSSVISVADKNTEHTATSLTIIDLLQTEFSNDYHEGWACIDEFGVFRIYTFYGLGRIKTVRSLRLRTQYSVPPGEPFHYNWIPNDNSSVTLRSKPLGIEALTIYFHRIERAARTARGRRVKSAGRQMV